MERRKKEEGRGKKEEGKQSIVLAIEKISQSTQ
jgi:hypothetical protein